jgi:Amt family ammonium transporter
MSSIYAIPYNGTTMQGCDSLTENCNQYYEVSLLLPESSARADTLQSGDIAWMLTSSALVLLMIPGVGFFYSGLARRKSALSLIWLSCMSIGVVSFQWFFWGYSLTFSHTANSYIGDLENIGFRNVLGAPSVGSPKIPDLLFAIYQGMFAAIT